MSFLAFPNWQASGQLVVQQGAVVKLDAEGLTIKDSGNHSVIWHLSD